MRPQARWLFRLAGLAALGYLALLFWVWRVSREDQRRPADAIVVLGAAQYNGRPSPVLRARLNHAILLYREGMAPLIVVTGGVAPGDAVSEAAVSHRYLLAKAIPDSAVVVRPEGRTTDASMAAVGRWARQRDLSTVLLVSDPFHMGRLRLEARRHRLHAYTSPAPSSPIARGSGLEWTYLALEAFKVPVAWLRRWY